MALSQTTAFCTGLIQTKLPLRNPQHSIHKFSDFDGVKIVPSSRIFRGSLSKSCGNGWSKYAIQSGRDSYNTSSNRELPQEPSFVPLIREALWAIRSLFEFLFEQPSQLKYIEWPKFTSTLKTALLTLVLVALLIVALSSVDSALSFLLAFVLRRPA